MTEQMVIQGFIFIGGIAAGVIITILGAYFLIKESDEREGP